MWHSHKTADISAVLLAATSAVTFWQGVALTITILSGVGALSLVGLRWYAWLKYGRLS